MGTLPAFLYCWGIIKSAPASPESLFPPFMAIRWNKATDYFHRRKFLTTYAATLKMMGFQSTAVTKPEQLQQGSKVLQDQIMKDKFSILTSLPDINELLQRGSVPVQNNQAQFQFLKQDAFKSVPDFMLQQYDSLQVSSFMGIFPEINRIWMTIDNQLYLWDYEDDDPKCFIAK